MKAAISAGYRHIDGAFIYRNEVEVGDGIGAMIKDGTVKREDLFIVSKVSRSHPHASPRSLLYCGLWNLDVQAPSLLYLVAVVHLPQKVHGQGEL